MANIRQSNYLSRDLDSGVEDVLRADIILRGTAPTVELSTYKTVTAIHKTVTLET